MVALFYNAYNFLAHYAEAVTDFHFFIFALQVVLPLRKMADIQYKIVCAFINCQRHVHNHTTIIIHYKYVCFYHFVKTNNKCQLIPCRNRVKVYVDGRAIAGSLSNNTVGNISVEVYLTDPVLRSTTRFVGKLVGFYAVCITAAIDTANFVP